MSEVEGATVVEEPEEGQEEESESEEQETEESVKPKLDELKIVIILKADKVMLGVQSPDCDPVYTTLQGTLAAALKAVPKLVKEAKEKWSTTPRNPKADLPEPEPSSTPAAPKQKPAQPKFF